MPPFALLPAGTNRRVLGVGSRPRFEHSKRGRVATIALRTLVPWDSHRRVLEQKTAHMRFQRA
jgi:hypothetical protein